MPRHISRLRRPVGPFRRLMCLVGACALAACSAQPPRPLAPELIGAPATPAIVEPPTPPPDEAIVEEPIEPGDDAGVDVEAPTTDTPPLPETAPSPLASITAATPPNVAAGTHLADQGRAQYAAGDYDTALEQLERAIAVDPTNPYAYYYLAQIHFARHNYDQAAAFADRAAVLSAKADRSWLSRCYELQGRVFETVGRFPDARRAYTRAVEAHAGNAAAQSGLQRLGGGAPPAP